MGAREHPLDGNVVLKLPISNSQGDPVSDKSKSVHVNKMGSNDSEDYLAGETAQGSSSGDLQELSRILNQKQGGNLTDRDVNSVRWNRNARQKPNFITQQKYLIEDIRRIYR